MASLSSGIFKLIFFVGCLFISTGEMDMGLVQGHENDLSINLWYGKNQHFGRPAFGQRWINILGNVYPLQNVKTCRYSLNDAPFRPFALGGDLHRLANPGDFNIDISLKELKKGKNRLVLLVMDMDEKSHYDTVWIQTGQEGSWPLPYEIDFSTIDTLQKAVQIVDGHWVLTPEGVRTVTPYYDRVLCMGDTNWTNYEALINLTIHDWTPSSPGPPTYNVSHFGVAMHWRGHHPDEHQPYRKWYPLGAQGEFLLKQEHDQCQWRILFDGAMKEKPPEYARKSNRIRKGSGIWIKSQVISTGQGKSRYSFKQWLDGEMEPSMWDVSGAEIQDYESGSLCLVPHNSDVTIHSIRVIPIKL